jgi:predicted phage terminase large subunit-like protein
VSVVDAELVALLLERDRILARDDLEKYNSLLWPDEMPAAHHRLILSAIKDAFEGRSPRVLIEAPPGSAKSSYGSIRGPSWFRGKFPKKDMIAASHTQELADKFGRRVRNTCQSPDWGLIFPHASVSQDSTAVNRWTMTQGGEYFGVGVGGLLPGRRADALILDDVAGGVTDAMASKVTRQGVWDWYVGDVQPRLKPNAAQIVIGTNFHSEDFLGRIKQLHYDGKEEWRIISFPWSALENDILGRKPGERLWPEYFTQEMEDRAKRNLDTWMALYQQQPIIESGSYFKREWIHEYDKAPENLRIYGVSDYAVTLGGGDFTVHLVAGVAEDGKIYLLDCWRGKTTPDVWIDELLRLAARWKPIEWWEEKGQITRGVGSFLDKAQFEKKIYFARSQYAMPRGADGLNSKQVGAQSIRGRFAQGMVWFPKGAHWLADAVAEMMAFPTEKAGVHDDFVDCLSLFGRALDKMVNATPKRAKQQPRFLGVDEPLTIGAFIKHSEAQPTTRKRI